jgi:anaerobic magnesium-protoporphyrin IX monomethyl ester cyclase
MRKDTIVFVAINDYDNLGVGYMAALLSEAGFKTKIIDFRVRKSDLVKILKKLDPLLIGFSIIFLNHINRFIGLIKYLRDKEINCHFTAGGHYASLRYEKLFQIIPQLDSIVRFEGEYPVLELANCLSRKKDWRELKSLAFKNKDQIIANPIRLPETDLDKFPYPSRSPLKEYAFGKKFTAILAGRGCVHSCSFCNTREFYRQAKSPLKRIRKPEMVAAEMNFLSDKDDCSVFIFHDDDFPVNSTKDANWVLKFCNELERTGLNKKILWKINCRPDDIIEESFSMMKKNGLFLIFLGLEDGTNIGLRELNKKLDVEDNIKSINILKKLNIGFDYGFMLFQPSTTFRSLNENLEFLLLVCGDGYTPVSFLKLVPLYETSVENELRERGRLIESDGCTDYEFTEEPMNRYYYFTMNCFSEWQRSPDGVENISKWARNYCSVYKHYYNDNPAGTEYCKKITNVIRESNLFLIDRMKQLADIFESDSDKSNKQLLSGIKRKIESKHNYFKNKIINTMAKLVSLVETRS